MRCDFMPFTLKHLSLKYLVLLGFIISLIPLGIFVWQSTLIQKNVSRSWQQLTDNSIESVRMVVELESLLVQVERSTKQALILQTKPVYQLASDNLGRYQKRIQEFSLIAPNSLEHLNTAQKASIQLLKERYTNIDKPTLYHLLAKLRRNQEEIMSYLWAYIDIAKQQQLINGLEKQKQVMLGLLMVSFVTFLLLIVFSAKLASPVNMLKEKIAQLGKDTPPLPLVSLPFHGTKELLEIDVSLDRLAGRLAKLEMLRQSFLRHASHEFKTPLASIIESCSILKDEISGPLTVTQKEVVVILEDSSFHLKHLTEQLLEYNYLLLNANPNLAKHDAKELLEASKQRYEYFFIKRQQNVRIDCLLASIVTDEKLFTRIIDNLLSNVQAYGFEHGNVLITLEADTDTSHYILIVANTGPSVPKAQQRKMLEPFVKSDVPRNDSLPGTGLGLSIVRDCVHLLNGTVEFIELYQFDFAVKVIIPMPNKGDL